MSLLQPHPCLASLPPFPDSSDQVRVLQLCRCCASLPILYQLACYSTVLCTCSYSSTFNLGTINDCGAHLINQGVVVSGNSATVEWQGTGPDPDNRVQDFQCSLDGGAPSSCKSEILHCVFFIVNIFDAK